MKNTNTNNALYLRRSNKILVVSNTQDTVPLNYVATMVRNFESYGYTFTEELIKDCTKLSLNELIELSSTVVSSLKKSVGAHQRHKPMYPNFPDEVMDMSEYDLYVNAICHYWSEGTWMPPADVKERFPLLDAPNLKQISLGDLKDFNKLFTQLVSSNVAWGVQDQEDISWFVENTEDFANLLPSSIPQKENMAFLVSALIKHKENATTYVKSFCKTATDVLRIAVALSGGDVSLATVTKFRNFSRAERVLILELLNSMTNPVEDMLRWKGRWIRLGEKLHAGEYKVRFPVAFDGFDKLRNNIKVETFNSKVEKTLVEKDVALCVATLRNRPGDFARRLDHILRLQKSSQEDVVTAFGAVANKISTPVLLQVMNHYKNRSNQPSLRTFFPKGNIAKIQSVENKIDKIPSKISKLVVSVCEDALVERFKKLPSLGDCYLDKNLEGYNVPFALRSASKTLRTLVRGSRIPLPDNCEVLRFFCWWMNGDSRADIDLSATTFDSDFKYLSVLSYYNLKGDFGCHSGDITNAPNGASEFIDVNLDKLRKTGARYVMMTLNSYTSQPYSELPECFAGWMSRDKINSGEIFEPRTVVDRIDLTAESKVAIPLVIDIVENKVIWCDLSLKNSPSFNNVANNLNSMQLTLKSLATMTKPNMYDLLDLHIKARGNKVSKASKAKTVFSVENETPFKLEEISSEYMV